jgi:ubiquinone/menaquinone biosynthesis C-methylase UbiE
MTSTFDPNQFKMDQRQNWDSVAEGWKQWWDAFEKGAQRLSNRLIELAKIKSGQRVLDIATGIGEPAITAAKIVGTRSHSAQMLGIAKERAASLGLQDIIEFKESDAEVLDLPDSAYDAVLCRRGLISCHLHRTGHIKKLFRMTLDSDSGIHILTVKFGVK